MPKHKPKTTSEILLAAQFQIIEHGPNHVQEKIAALERSEDCRFSPDGRKLAVAGFAKNSVVIFDVEVDLSGPMPKILLSDYTELISDKLDYPHGLDFVDNSTMVVANRARSVSVFDIHGLRSQKQTNIEPVVSLTRADMFNKLNSPGSVSVVRANAECFELLVCNNYSHRVSQHTISRGKALKVTRNQIVFDKGLNVPDGVAVSSDKSMIAVSNHYKHQVNLYPNDGTKRRATLPTGVLKGLDFPHGLRFFRDDKYLLVADAGLPFARLYHSADGHWRGEHMPVKTIRIMDDEVFLKGHFYHQEGGLKGLDFSPCQRILATTCEMQPLVFYDAARMFPA